MTHGPFTIRKMSAEQLLDEGMELFARHREELTTNKALMVLNPHRQAYLNADAAGAMIVLGAFDGAGELVGYSANLIAPNLHYADLLMCQNDVLFVVHKHRGTSIGVRLIRETEAQAALAGCRLMLWHAKPGTPLDRLLPRMGCKVQDIIHSKVLD
jgi:predicted GNAT superfamily acetyltransferase